MSSFRKTVFAVLSIVMLLCSGLIFAGNDMNIIPLSSPMYEYVDLLYTMEGHAAPQGARPWTEADFRQQMKRIEPSNDASRRLYEEIMSHLSDGDKKVSAGGNLTIQPSFGYHLNPADFDASSKWRSQRLNDKLMMGEFNLFISDYFAASLGLSFGVTDSANLSIVYNDENNNGKMDKGEYIKVKYTGDEDRFKDSWATNIPFLSGSIDVDVTDHSFVSLGNPYISLSVGRNQLSWGNGAMGNLMLGNTLPYHDYLSISASNNTWFDYTMLMTFYTHPMNYSHGFDDATNDGLQLFLGHRFEFRMFSDKLRLTLNEAIMYQSESGNIDFRIFNPLLVMHGFYIPANANSLATFELEFSPVKSLQFYFSFAIDDIALNEVKAPEAGSTLNMWGMTGGIRITKPVHDAYLKANVEVVYTSPFMYHKDSYFSAPYSQDFVGSVRFNMGKNYVRRYLSFPFGSDALAIQGKVTYGKPFSHEVGMNVFLMAHGITDENTIAKKYDGTNNYVPGFLATQNPFDSSEKGAISYTLDIGFEGTYYILDTFTLSAGVDFIFVQNLDNIPGNNKGDIQLTIGMKYSIF